MTITQSYSSDGPISTSTATPVTVDSTQCQACDGKGEIVRRIPNPFNVAEGSLQNKKCEACDGTGKAQPDLHNVTISQDELNMRKQETISHIVNDITIPSLRMLLTQVLTTIDVAIPNKDQNRAVKRTIREDFDTAYFGILGRAYPECNYASFTEGRFALEPAPVKEGNSPLS